MNTLTQKNILLRHEETHPNRLKTTPPALYTPPLQEQRTQQAYLLFQHNEYPFLNAPTSPMPTLKTILNLNPKPEKLQKIVKINHPNIISIRKIVKNSPRQTTPSPHVQTHYTFYYQPVIYSLKYLSEHPQDHPRLYNLLLSTNLRSILFSVAEYLGELDIFYPIRLQDIGISTEGNLKIFIPPTFVFQTKNNPNIQHIQKSLLSIAEWWQRYQQGKSSPFKKQKKSQLQPPILTNHDDLECDEPSFPESTLERELGELLGETETQTKATHTLKQSINSLSKIGSIQMEKFKKIDQEIKNIRSRLNQKKTKDTKKSDINPQIKRQPLKISPKLFQSQIVADEKAKQNKNYCRQPIQQNINCINIYNHNSHPTRITTLPNYLPPAPAPAPPKHYYQHNLDPEFYRDHQDQYSQDTYDIQFETHFESPPVNNNNVYRQTNVSQENDFAKYSQHHRKKPKQNNWQKELRSKANTNQVCNKNYTESAGPLQFKSFLSKYMKTQGTHKPQLTSTRNHQEQSISNYNQQSMRTVSYEKGIKQRPINGKLVSENDKGTDIKRNHSHNDFTSVNRLAANGQRQIEQKVKKALEKTKNAIALLNRVKQNRASKPISIIQ